MSIAKEGCPIIGIAFVIALIVVVLALWWSNVFGFAFASLVVICAFWTIWFFRDPVRVPPPNTDLSKAIICPADGVILAIEEVDEEEFFHKKILRVSIFMNVFNVHVNRIPVAGHIVYKKHTAGIFLSAFKPEASRVNARASIGVECDRGFKMLVTQISGYVARRIVNNAEVGQTYAAGEKFGLIRFGSRVNLHVPLGTTITVKPGEKVFSGATILGKRQ